ncbi:MAG: efflux RND transporter periplasmic adaptor subunit [Variibacter sp.]|nr:efflux RND transporter periplasmic adaptor subunit [Variibacter sp.]
MSRAIKVLLLVAVVAGAVAGGIYWRRMSELTLATVPMQTGVEVRVFAVGSVEAQVLSKVGFQIGGKLVEIAVDQGDQVQKGSLLARLDDTAQRTKLLKSEVAVRQAAANLGRSRAQGERAASAYQQKKSVNARRQTLLARGSVAQEAADDAQAGEEMALSDLKVAEADAAIASVLRDDAAAQRQIDTVLLEQHELRAPFEARVIARHKELGSVANAGEAVFTLIAADSIWVRAYVDEARAGGLRPGQTAFVRLRSEPQRVVEAEIVRIDQENDRVTEERRVYVRCRACSPQHQIRYLGEQAEVEIVKGVASGLFIPMNAVEGFDGRGGFVWAIENGRLAKLRVQLGERLLDGRVQIGSQIPPGVAIVAVHRDGLWVGRPAKAAAAGK